MGRSIGYTVSTFAEGRGRRQRERIALQVVVLPGARGWLVFSPQNPARFVHNALVEGGEMRESVCAPPPWVGKFFSAKARRGRRACERDRGFCGVVS